MPKSEGQVEIDFREIVQGKKVTNGLICSKLGMKTQPSPSLPPPQKNKPESNLPAPQYSPLYGDDFRSKQGWVPLSVIEAYGNVRRPPVVQPPP